MDYELVVAGSQVPIDSVPTGVKYVVATSELGLVGAELDKYIGEGFTVYTLSR
jgi:hypothetical protein